MKAWISCSCRLTSKQASKQASKILFLWTILCSCGQGCPLAFGAVDFDGVDDYVNAGNAASLKITGSLTVAAWVKADAFPNGDDNYIVTKSGDGVEIAFKFTATIDQAVEQFYIKVTSDGTTGGQRYTATTITAGTWYHVAGVFNASLQTLDIYLNGQLDNGTLGGTVPSSMYDNNNNVLIGTNTNRPDRSFDGLIDDVRIYNRALSPSEVEVIAKGRLKYDSLTTPGNGLVGYWPLDDSPDGTSGDGDTFKDRSGNGNNGTGVDGANNTGLTAKASGYLMYPAPVQ